MHVGEAEVFLKQEVVVLDSVLAAIGFIVVLGIVFRITGMNYFKLEIGRTEPPPKQLEK